MAITSRDTVVAIAPELGGIAAADARWALFIADVETEISSQISEKPRERIARYLVAHLMTLSERKGKPGAGAIQSVIVGGITRTYATNQGATTLKGTLSQTSYGQEAARLLSIHGPRMMVI